MKLRDVIDTVEGYASRLPYNIRCRVGTDGPLVWVQAWAEREVAGLDTQLARSERVVVRETYGKFGPWLARDKVLAAACDATQQLVEKLNDSV